MKKLVAVAVIVMALALTLMTGAAWANSSAAPSGEAVTAAATPQASGDRAWVGVSVANLNARLAQRFNLSGTQGVVVTGVAAKGPAAEAGVKIGDLLTAVNGVTVQTAQAASTELHKVKVGDKVTVVVTRGAEKLTLTLTAQAAPATAQRSILPRLREKLNNLKNRLALPQELQRLQDVPAGERFNHNYGTTRTIKDKDGKTVTISTIPGVVTAISPTSITITPNNPQSKGGPFSIDGTTRTLVGKNSSGTDAIAVNDQVVVTVVGDSSHASVITKALAGSGRGNLLRRVLPAMRRGA